MPQMNAKATITKAFQIMNSEISMNAFSFGA
jgi:hypothetical protein